MKLLATLLHYANADPPTVHRREFYDLKTGLLRKHAYFKGHEIQWIRKPCWGERHYNRYGDEEYVDCGPKCRRCGGTGIFSERWVRLELWVWSSCLFHIPAGDTRKRPDSDPRSWIEGRIQHADYGRKSDEALLWLYLLCGEWRLLGQQLRSSYCCGRYFWPLLNLQRVVTILSMKLRWDKCPCGRWYWAKGGWLVCKKCRNQPSEIPF